MENNIDYKKELVQLSKRIVRILKNKTLAGCDKKIWEGFYNGNGTEVGKDIDNLIRKAESILRKEVRNE